MAKEGRYAHIRLPSGEVRLVNVECMATIGQVGKQKDLSALATLRLETYREGLAVQIMYTGSYDDEGPTIACMHAFIEVE